MIVSKKQVNQLLQESKSCFISGISFCICVFIYGSFWLHTPTCWTSSRFDSNRHSIVCCFCSILSNSETMEAPSLRHFITPSSLSSISGINSISGSDSITLSYVAETSLSDSECSFEKTFHSSEERTLGTHATMWVEDNNKLQGKSKAHLSSEQVLKAFLEEKRFVRLEE